MELRFYGIVCCLICSFNVTVLFSWWSDSSGEYFAGLKIWWFKCLGIYGLIWCAQLLIFWLHPWYMMLWLKIFCFILPLWWFTSKKYREQDMRADGLIIGTEMDMNFHWNTGCIIGWHGNMGNLFCCCILCSICYQLLLVSFETTSAD